MHDFYDAVAGACFALLGLWWVVVELNHDRWLRDPVTRRSAYRVSLYFLLPGTISVVSLLDVESPVFWRSVFLAGAVVGLVDVVAARPHSAQRRPQLVVSFVVYALVAAVAVAPQLLVAVGVVPLVVEGILLALLILLGAQLAWTHFVASATDPTDEQASGRRDREA